MTEDLLLSILLCVSQVVQVTAQSVMIDVSLGSRKTASSVIHTVARTSWQVSCGFVCSYRFLLLVMINGYLRKFAWWLIYYGANLCWLLWTLVHDSVVRAVECRSGGPWFNSGWRSWFTFMTCSDNPMNQISQMFISKSPITRKSVKILYIFYIFWHRCTFFLKNFFFFFFIFLFFTCFLLKFFAFFTFFWHYCLLFSKNFWNIFFIFYIYIFFTIFYNFFKLLHLCTFL